MSTSSSSSSSSATTMRVTSPLLQLRLPDLPADILLLVLTHLDCAALAQLMQTCTRLDEVIRRFDAHLWPFTGASGRDDLVDGSRRATARAAHDYDARRLVRQCVVPPGSRDTAGRAVVGVVMRHEAGRDQLLIHYEAPSDGAHTMPRQWHASSARHWSGGDSSRRHPATIWRPEDDCLVKEPWQSQPWRHPASYYRVRAGPKVELWDRARWGHATRFERRGEFIVPAATAWHMEESVEQLPNGFRFLRASASGVIDPTERLLPFDTLSVTDVTLSEDGLLSASTFQVDRPPEAVAAEVYWRVTECLTQYVRFRHLQLMSLDSNKQSALHYLFNATGDCCLVPDVEDECGIAYANSHSAVNRLVVADSNNEYLQAWTIQADTGLSVSLPLTITVAEQVESVEVLSNGNLAIAGHFRVFLVALDSQSFQIIAEYHFCELPGLSSWPRDIADVERFMGYQAMFQAKSCLKEAPTCEYWLLDLRPTVDGSDPDLYEGGQLPVAAFLFDSVTGAIVNLATDQDTGFRGFVKHFTPDGRFVMNVITGTTEETDLSKLSFASVNTLVEEEFAMPILPSDVKRLYDFHFIFRMHMTWRGIVLPSGGSFLHFPDDVMQNRVIVLALDDDASDDDDDDDDADGGGDDRLDDDNYDTPILS